MGFAAMVYLAKEQSLNALLMLNLKKKLFAF
jgi:hypothetical protein